MLVVSSSSACDVCLEPYGCEPDRAPYVIPCGHPFCYKCLSQIRPPLALNCPLCRQPFDPRDPRKLIVDFNEGSPRATEQASVESHADSAAVQTARRFQEALSKVVYAGSSEENVRVILDECLAFLKHHPKPAFEELRVTARLLNYLSDVKKKYRGQATAVNKLGDEVARLSAAHDSLEKRYMDLQFEKDAEKAVALATEKSFRDHCLRLEGQYDIISNKYKSVVSEWSRLNDFVEDMRRHPNAPASEFLRTMEHFQFAPEDLSVPQVLQPTGPSPAGRPAPAAARSEPEYFISPLPEFTMALPSMLDLMPPSPVAEVREERREEFPLSRFASCGSEGCPDTCGCPAMLPSLSSSPRDSSSPPSSRSSYSSSPASDLHGSLRGFPRTPPSARASPPRSPALAAHGDHSTPLGGLSISAPSYIGTSVRKTSPPDSRSFPPKPSLHPIPDSPPISSPPPPLHSSSYREAGNGGDRVSRLRELLNDPSTSSSLPNMTGSHFNTPAPAADLNLTKARENRPQSPHLTPSKPQLVPPVITGTHVSRASDAAVEHERQRRAERERKESAGETHQYSYDRPQISTSSSSSSRPTSGTTPKSSGRSDWDRGSAPSHSNTVSLGRHSGSQASSGMYAPQSTSSASKMQAQHSSSRTAYAPVQTTSYKASAPPSTSGNPSSRMPPPPTSASYGSRDTYRYNQPRSNQYPAGVSGQV